MARSTITPAALTKTGYNVTDASFTTMGTGANNGVQFALDPDDIVILRNDTAGAAVYTVKVPGETKYSEKGATVPDVPVTVAAGKIWLYPLSKIFQQSDGRAYIDCDVAGKILVVSP